MPIGASFKYFGNFPGGCLEPYPFTAPSSFKAYMSLANGMNMFWRLHEIRVSVSFDWSAVGVSNPETSTFSANASYSHTYLVSDTEPKDRICAGVAALPGIGAGGSQFTFDSASVSVVRNGVASPDPLVGHAFGLSNYGTSSPTLRLYDGEEDGAVMIPFQLWSFVKQRVSFESHVIGLAPPGAISSNPWGYSMNKIADRSINFYGESVPCAIVSSLEPGLWTHSLNNFSCSITPFFWDFV